MANTRTYNRSFAGGELSPEMFGRIDDAKYQAGAATLRNFLATPQGPAENRPGFQYVNSTKGNGVARLIPFTYSTDQTMVIEVGPGYFRFHTQGATLLKLDGTPYEVVNPYAQADLFSIHYVQSADVLTLVHPNYPPAELKRLGATDWTYSAISFTPAIDPPSGVTVTPSPGFKTKIASVSGTTITTAANHTLVLGDPIYIAGIGAQSGFYLVAKIPTDTGGADIPNQLQAMDYDGNLLSITGSVSGATIQYGSKVYDINSYYVVTAVADNGVDESKVSAEVSALNNLDVTGSYNTIVFSATENRSVYGITADATTHTATIDVGTGNASGLSVGDNISLKFPGVDLTGVGTTITAVPSADSVVVAYDGSSDWSTSGAATGGAITGVTVSEGGTYKSRPVVIINGDGTGAVAQAVMVYSGPSELNVDSVTVTSPGSGYTWATVSFSGGSMMLPAAATASIGSTTASAIGTLSIVASDSPARYRVYKKRNGLYGFIGETTESSFVDDNIAPDLGITPPIYDPVFASENNYPGTVSYAEQRRIFAGTNNEPQKFWMSKSATESNFSYSLPIADDDRIAATIASREANTIRHIVPLTQLLLLTSSAEVRVSPVNSDALTPSTISAKPQSYVGASNVQPVIVNNALVYCAARGGHVRELGYNWQANGFITGDLSLRAAHLFDNLSIVDQAFTKAPRPIVWFVSSNGKLLGLTYIPEEQIGAWHWHDTDGIFESITAVAEGEEDRLYAVIRRTINGATVRYIERLASRQFAEQKDAFFVDCGATYSGSPATEISGLSFLEGKTVSILADGAVCPQKVVTGGKITLDHAASTVHVGLPITADLQTLPLIMQIDGFGQGRTKNINKVWLKVWRSGGIFVGPDVSHLTEAKQRSTELYGTAPALKTGTIEVTTVANWQQEGQLAIRQSDPLPLTVSGITMEVSIGG